MERLLGILLAAALGLTAQDTRYPPDGSQIPGPGRRSTPGWVSELSEWQISGSSEHAAWLSDLQKWRHERLIRMGYDDAEYRRPELLWTQRNFIQPQMMAEERYFYDPAAGKYTVDRYLDDLDKRYGGIDSVLIWPVYPNIGIDNRNQWDLARDLPGGVPALRGMVEDFRHRGVRVFFPSMPWDTGTRDVGVPYWTATAQLMAEIGADGVNGDTFDGLPRAYRTASDGTGHPVAFEPEGSPRADEQLMWNNQSWGYWKYPFAPMVSKLKWLEPRHMINVCDRWARDKTDNLQAAFFNGVGYESWENIWGIWNQITPRDAEALRRVAYVERHFADLLVAKGWEPYAPVLEYGVFATRFPGEGRTLWTLVNRNEYDIHGEQIELPHRQGERYYDVWHGEQLQPRIEGAQAVLSFGLEAKGFGAILAVMPDGAPQDLDAILAQMRQWSGVPLASLPHEWSFLPQHIVEIAPTRPPSGSPPGMVRVPGGPFDFEVAGIEIEGSNWIGLDVQYPWEDAPRRGHRHLLSMKPFYIDRYPVTNADFKKFLDATHYHPRDDHNFLKDWHNGNYPQGWANKPVTWVSLEDARAYAAWAGKRLPHEWEWQYAAQGADGRLYPWGKAWDARAVPTPYKGRDLPGPADVDAHPAGASAFGAMDMTGNVWQWTDEYVDEHTRAAILRGGSYYQPQGSMWYFPQAYKLNEHGKYLLMAPSKDRAGTLGFRCVMDE
ncbi:MAG TPA: formylglycine-generating enzyme family protein [Bryobacteraceae bacterium]|nr:formylglycine-generating enzyme family protein [Bryobacteraceae bacterium]